MTTRLVVARHGQAAYETSTVTDDGGWLTASGREQARALGTGLVDRGVVRVWSSPLSRAVQTAEIAAGVLGVDVVVREGLREYGVGDLTGAPDGESETIGPVFRSWADGDDDARIPGAERISDIVARVHVVLEEVAAAAPGRTSLVVGHGGALLAAVPVLAGRPRASAYDLVLAPAGVLVLERPGGPGDGPWRWAQGEASLTSGVG